MKPYYQDDLVTIYHGDCKDILPNLGKLWADVLITDPPFFMPATHYQSRVKWQRTWGDTSVLKTFWGVILDACVPCLKTTGHFMTFCNHESYPVFYPEMYGRFDFLKAIVWDKGHVGLGRVWRNQHELIIAARWQASIFYEDGRLRSDVMKYTATQSQDRTHPVEKPKALLADLIIPTTVAGNIVVDPFAGGGSTLDAARALGRRSIGIEIEEKYCEAMAQKFSQSVITWTANNVLQPTTRGGLENPSLFPVAAVAPAPCGG